MKKNLKISFDVDGVLLQCVEYAIERINEECKVQPPLRIEEFDEYDPVGERTSLTTAYYASKEFVLNQPLYDGAQELIRWVVNRGHEVFFVTAVPPQCMSERATQLVKLFPEVPATNIIMATRKELVRTDIHVDDAPHNILKSKAHYPVMFRRIWNQKTDGVLSVNNYEELKTLIRQIEGSVSFKKKTSPSIVCLIGPTGAGKKEIQSMLANNPAFCVPEGFTTCPLEDGEKNYRHISKEEFDSLLYRGELFEYSSYGGHWYGLMESEIESVLEKGKTAVLTVDMPGANAIKAAYPDKTITVFVRKNKEDSITDVIEREISLEDKVKRLASLEAELRNESLCDMVVLNTGTTESAVQQIFMQLGK